MFKGFLALVPHTLVTVWGLDLGTKIRAWMESGGIPFGLRTTWGYERMSTAEGRIEAGRIETLIRQQPLALIAQLLNAGLLALMLRHVWPTNGLYTWLGAVAVVIAIQFLLWTRYRGRALSPREVPEARRSWTLLAVYSGALWGLPCAVFFPQEGLAVQGFMVFVLGGMAACAVATLSSHLPAYYGFLTPALMPVIVRMTLESGTIYMAMGIIGTIFMLVLIGTARNLNRTLTESLRLQFEKSDLVDELTEARTQAESANAAKSAFLATVSHELRTPLNAVLGFNQLMALELHGPLGSPKYQEYARLINESGDHLLELIDEVIDLSRAESGQLDLSEETVDIGGLVNATIKTLEPIASRNRIVLQVSAEPPLPSLKADPRRTRQILLNVINNAIKFTPVGGKVFLSITPEADGSLAIHVRDTGIGMSKTDLSTAFELFGRGDNAVQRVIDGAGIGLPLTRFLMRLHDGDIELASEQGEGTEVTLRFPPERVIEAGRHPAPSTAQPQSKLAG